jgi:hypothetical protein
MVGKKQAAIKAALTALTMEPQPNTSLKEWFWAKQALEQGLTRIGHVLAAHKRAPVHR